MLLTYVICPAGENACNTCLRGSYSLDPQAQECSRCPVNAVCDEGFYLRGATGQAHSGPTRHTGMRKRLRCCCYCCCCGLQLGLRYDCLVPTSSILPIVQLLCCVRLAAADACTLLPAIKPSMQHSCSSSATELQPQHTGQMPHSWQPNAPAGKQATCAGAAQRVTVSACLRQLAHAGHVRARRRSLSCMYLHLSPAWVSSSFCAT
jgi:hypothetical protein